MLLEHVKVKTRTCTPKWVLMCHALPPWLQHIRINNKSELSLHEYSRFIRTTYGVGVMSLKR